MRGPKKSFSMKEFGNFCKFSYTMRLFGRNPTFKSLRPPKAWAPPPPTSEKRIWILLAKSPIYALINACLVRDKFETESINNHKWEYQPYRSKWQGDNCNLFEAHNRSLEAWPLRNFANKGECYFEYYRKSILTFLYYLRSLRGTYALDILAFFELSTRYIDCKLLSKR